MSNRIAIIGAGIVGATTAYHLSKQGAKITIFDEETGQATKAAAGIICPWLSQRRNKDWYQLTAQGAAYYPQLMQQLAEDGIKDLPYKQVGALVFKKTDALLEKLTHIALERREAAPRIGELQAYPSGAIEQFIPGWQGTHGALYCEGGGRVDGKKLVEQLLAIAQQKGATLIKERVSLRPSEEPGRVVIETSHGTQVFDQVIVSAGAWVKELIEPLGYEVDVRPQKGQLIELELQTDEETGDWPVCMLHGEIDILPFENGKIIVGATHENEQGFDLTADEALQEKMYQEACEVYPALQQAVRSGFRIGTRAYTSDFLPFFGAVPELPNVFVASGLGSSGLTSGVWIGELLSRLVLDQPLDFEIESYSPNNYIQKNI